MDSEIKQMCQHKITTVMLGSKKAACREGPLTEIRGLLDHLVGNGEQFIWDGEAELLGRLEIDH
jgi:hypothetical protein